jgi:hypothetical protein
MYGAADFEAAALQVAAEYPGLSARIRVGDPRIMSILRGQAAQLAMLSGQVEVARYEWSERARDAVVLADATMRGILPIARPALITIDVTNRGSSRYEMSPGRRMVDHQGRMFVTTSAVSIDVGATARVQCQQRIERTVSTTIQAGVRFYRLEVPHSPDRRIAGFEVWRVRGAASQQFEYRPDYCNTAVGDMSYTCETDERRRLYVRFGAEGSIGYQVQAGDVFEVRVADCDGRITGLPTGSVFSFEHIMSIADSGISDMRLASIEDFGADPPAMRDLRVLAQYPTLYNDNAVHLGNFDFVLRRKMSGVRFLSTWNEQIEEAVRGPNVANINTLFVSGLVQDMDQPTFREMVESIIRRADDSYRIAHVPVVMSPVAVSVSATVQSVHDVQAVAAKIRSAIIAEMGDGAATVSMGMRNRVTSSHLHKLLRESVQELRDSSADININVKAHDRLAPEMFLHVTHESLTVRVDRIDQRFGLWNSGAWNVG